MVRGRSLVFCLSSLVKKNNYGLWTMVYGLILLFSSCGNGWIPLSLDKTLGEQGKAQVESSMGGMKILEKKDHPVAYKKLETIRDRILASGNVLHKDDFPWEVKIVEDDSVLNAFCLPGGYIYVFTGLIKYLDSEDALAGVMGHEIAHADMRHSSSQLAKNMGLSLLIRLVFGSDGGGLVDLGANLLSLSFSRGDESEADMKSVEYLYNTPYDARGAGIFFEKIRKDNKDPGMLEILSTHPDPGNREEKIQEKWTELGGKPGEKFEESYKELLSDLK